jgi:hypothetical protein
VVGGPVTVVVGSGVGGADEVVGLVVGWLVGLRVDCVLVGWLQPQIASATANIAASRAKLTIRAG